MADVKQVEEIGLSLQERKKAQDEMEEEDIDRDRSLTDNENWILNCSVDDGNWRSALERLSFQEVIHLLKVEKRETARKKLNRRKRKLMEDLGITDESLLPQSSPGRTYVKPESWDNEGFRQRVNDSLRSADYFDVDIALIMLPKELNVLAKYQYRRDTKPERLVASILAKGVLEVITLQKAIVNDEIVYYIIDGHTRYLAWLKAREQDPSIPVPNFRTLEIDDADAAQVAVELNRFQENLSEEDMYALVIRMVEEAGVKQTDIAEQLGMSTSYISDIVAAFHKVPTEARRMIEAGNWTVKHGRMLSRLHEHPKAQMRIFKQALRYDDSAAKLEERVKKTLLSQDFVEKATKDISKVVDEVHDDGQIVGTVTEDQVYSIHNKLLEKHGTRSGSYGRGYVLADGKVEATVPESQVRKILQEAGYEIVKKEEAVSTTPDQQVVKKKPKMPSKEELMDDPYKRCICPICKGPTHPVVVKELGFVVNQRYYDRNTGKSGTAHAHCYLMKEIAQSKEYLLKLEKKLAAESLQKLFSKKKSNLETLNNEAHAIYKAELERRKQAWRDKNLPKPARTKKKGTKVGEPVSKKPKDPIVVLQKLRKKQPDLVAQKYWDPYERYLKKEEGYQTQRQIFENDSGLSKGSVFRAFKKLEKAISEEVAL